MANEVKTINGMPVADTTAREEIEKIKQGSGTETPGADGYSPIANVEQTDTGAVITIIDKNGTTTATITNGKDGESGENGADGNDGYSPEVSIMTIAGGYRISITDINGTHYFNVFDGTDGQNGTSVTVSNVSESTEDGGSNVVTFSDGKTLTVKNGKTGATGATGKNGKDGSDANVTSDNIKSALGYTPADAGDVAELSEAIADQQAEIDGKQPKGNYLTEVPSEYVTEDELEAEINDLKAQGVQQTPLFAESVEWLNENGDTSKVYVLPDGYIYAYTKKVTATVGGWSENLVPTSIDTDGSIFNGTGYKDEYRLNSSGVVTSQENSTVIGFIPAKKGDKFQITGVRFGTTQTANVYGYVSLYDASKTKIVSQSCDNIHGNPNANSWVVITPLSSSGTILPTDVVTIDFATAQDNVAFVRFSSSIHSNVNVTKQSGADMVVTKWVEGGTEITEGWNNTGHAFVPADYEGRIVEAESDILALNKKSLEHEERLAELEENGMSGSASNIIPEGLEWLDGYSIPRLVLDGSTDGMTKDNEVSLTYECKDKDGNTKTGSCTMKWQGSSSIAYEKKNYTIKFDNAFEVIAGWGSQKKYCLKANFIDHSHARNVVSAKLWGQVTKSRASVDSRLSALPNAGAVDGFPIIIILNGEFHGLYTWNIPKDGWMFGMSDSTVQQAIVCADKYVDATSFKALAVLDGSDFELEYSSDDQSEWVKTSLNRMLQAVINSNGSDLDTTVSQYLDIDSAIDYIIHTVLIEAADCVQKNYILATYDGVKWFFSAYDMDSTFGLHWHGKDFSGLSSVPTFQSWKDNKLMNLLLTKKRDVINARYAELRQNAMSEHNVAKTFWNFGCLIPKPILLKDVEKWTSIPSSTVNDINQILTQYRLRCMLADEWIKA